MVEICDNGIDDDLDTLIDCDDSDCDFDPVCIEPEICDNGIDDDNDGVLDCNDPDCLVDPVCQNTVASCPVNPSPAPLLNFIMDGTLDPDAILLDGGLSSVRIMLAFSDDGRLYVATDDSGEGADHFFFVSATLPDNALFPAPFAKNGQVQVGTGDMLFLADENDNDFSGWFRLNSTGIDTLLSGNEFLSATGINGGVLEGSLDLTAAFGTLPEEVFVSAILYGNEDGGIMIDQAQTPSGNGDGDVNTNEFLHICLPGLEIVQ